MRGLRAALDYQLSVDGYLYSSVRSCIAYSDTVTSAAGPIRRAQVILVPGSASVDLILGTVIAMPGFIVSKLPHAAFVVGVKSIEMATDMATNALFTGRKAAVHPSAPPDPAAC